MTDLDKALYIFEAAYLNNVSENDMIKSLYLTLEIEDGISHIDYNEFVYYPDALKILLDKTSELDDGYIYTMFNRILDHDLPSFDILFDYLKDKKWVSKTDYLRLRPYLLVNIDSVKISKLYVSFNLVDPRFMNLFYNMNLEYNDLETELNRNYFGYRQTWYNLFYEEDENITKKLIKYIVEAGDCSTSGLVDYILWLQNIQIKQGDKYKVYFDHYENIIYNYDVDITYNTLVSFNKIKNTKILEILESLKYKK